VSPEPAHVSELGHGISQIQLPLPFPRLPWVNAFVVVGEEELTLIDCGVDSEESWDALAGGLAILGHGIADITQLICTHLHVDHMGMSARVVAATGARFIMHEATNTGLAEYNEWGTGIARLTALAARHGMPQSSAQAIAEVAPRPDWAALGIPPTDPIANGDHISIGADRSFEVLHTPGHEEAHICLIDSRTGVLLSGDHVLPRITPGVRYDADQDRLGAYIESLQRIETLTLGLTYPAHGTMVEQGSLRARQIILHHERRLGAIIQELRTRPRTAWDIMEAIFRPNLMAVEKRMAFSETLAHLDHLEHRGEASSFEEDGTTHYRLPPRKPTP
jgi:glyoxylase-like metal-dependent hydrolase (beta-lactamase superfamily II)